MLQLQSAQHCMVVWQTQAWVKRQRKTLAINLFAVWIGEFVWRSTFYHALKPLVYLIPQKLSSCWSNLPQSINTDWLVGLWLLELFPMEATWLILPVVIRSSQRLSHARLSINILLWNCEWLIISVIIYLIVPYYSDNRSNSRANTCVDTQLSSIYWTEDQPFRGDVVIHNKLADRMALPAIEHWSFCPLSFGW